MWGWLLGAAAGCDSQSNDTTRVEAEEHSGHAAAHGDGNGPADTSLLWAAAAANKVVLSAQGSVPVRLTDTTVTARGYGRIAWDKRRNRRVTVRTAGRVERLYVRYGYQYVRRGQKVLELYTPELATYAAEYLHHLQTPGDEALLALSRKKLALLGVTPRQMAQLEATGRLPTAFTVYSSYGGYMLTEDRRNNMPATMGAGTGSGSMGDAMSSDPTPAAYDAGDGPLREGMYVNRGQTLFYVNDFAVAWGVLSFDAGTQPWLKKGMSVVIKSELLSLPVRSTLAFIEPTFDDKGQKFMQVRVYLPNTGQRFKIHSLIEGRIDIPLHRKLIIPAASVLSLGKRTIVWVKAGQTASGKNIFRAREVQVSLLNPAIAVVESGLSPTEEVAVHAGYLLDNQSLVEP